MHIENEQEILHAIKAHKSVGEALQASQIVLSKPDFQIVRRLELANAEGTRVGSPEIWQHLDLYRAITASNKHASSYLPDADDHELDLKRRWASGGNHHLLMEMISQGRLPLAWADLGGPDNPPRLDEAMKVARSLGYNIPDRYITDSKDTTYTEKEAFHAAHMIARGHFNQFNTDEGTSDLQEFRRSLCQLTGQFVVPDPIYPDRPPYFLDQLWIIALPDRTVRLIAIEIDGEVHLSDENIEKTQRRDRMLAAMGYEVYHVAGWWCRIDPYRAILSALAAAGLIQRAHYEIPGAELASIDQYRCGICDKPMVRWDIDWIVSMPDGSENISVHRCCASDALKRSDYC